jgi:hypothetical protein
MSTHDDDDESPSTFYLLRELYARAADSRHGRYDTHARRYRHAADMLAPNVTPEENALMIAQGEALALRRINKNRAGYGFPALDSLAR